MCAAAPFICRLKSAVFWRDFDNRGGINGWVGPHAIYGIAITIEP